VLGCLEAPLDGQVPVEGAACLFGPVFLGGRGVIPGSNSDAFVINAFYAGGTGARPQKDGLSCTAFPSGVRSTPVEITENSAPLIMWQKEYRPNSGGPGQYRGGLGQIMEFAHAKGEAFAVSKMFDRIDHPPRGRDGGGAGAPARVYLKSGKTLKGMGREIIPAGESMILETAGGGGRGDAAARDAGSIGEDRKNGLLSLGAAPAGFRL
jgi:N-methylhydantoinase B